VLYDSSSPHFPFLEHQRHPSRRTTATRHPPAHITMAAIPSSLFRWVVPGALAFSLAQSSIYDVKGGTRAVIFDRLSGVKEQVVNEGTHFLVPWLQRAIVFDVRTRPRNISTTTGSKDLQMVTLTLRVLHRPEVKQLPKIYQVRIGTRSLAALQWRRRTSEQDSRLTRT
jgi:regulator of protease activity HflC (stomatin/prohibitin superfamily)